ncbi:glycosyl hydrolase family 8 [Cryptosporangium sp. NPDC048952]|uniref:glycosyl hydrolase family 8 n=1 Tax=Cryptosporangium sp. NPDC048952 TaxID=3363961 RepID=UPI0037114D4A
MRIRIFTAALVAAAATLVSCSSEPDLAFSGSPTELPHAAIRPSASQDERDQALVDFYQAWKDEYVHDDCGDGAFQIYSPDAAYPFVSEAQGYGLTIAAMMSKADPDAKGLFDGLLTYVLDHPSTRTPDLMAAEQDSKCNDKAGGDSATDGDMDIAYGLLLADSLWGSDGDFDYRDLAGKRINAVKAKTVNTSSDLMLLGDWDTAMDAGLYATTRTSDWMPYYFGVFEAATGDDGWSTIADAHQQAVADLQNSDTGLLPDFARTTDDGIQAVSGKVLETANDGDYSFNACRVPWRLGTDALLTGAESSTTAARTIDAWFRATTDGDPGKVGSGYRLDGTAEDADPANAFWAPLAVSAMTDPDGQEWLDALWRKLAENDVERGNYYGDTIQLQVMILLAGRYLTV